MLLVCSFVFSVAFPPYCLRLLLTQTILFLFLPGQRRAHCATLQAWGDHKRTQTLAVSLVGSVLPAFACKKCMLSRTCTQQSLSKLLAGALLALNSCSLSHCTVIYYIGSMLICPLVLLALTNKSLSWLDGRISTKNWKNPVVFWLNRDAVKTMSESHTATCAVFGRCCRNVCKTRAGNHFSNNSSSDSTLECGNAPKIFKVRATFLAKSLSSVWCITRSTHGFFALGSVAATVFSELRVRLNARNAEQMGFCFTGMDGMHEKCQKHLIYLVPSRFMKSFTFWQLAVCAIWVSSSFTAGVKGEAHSRGFNPTLSPCSFRVSQEADNAMLRTSGHILVQNGKPVVDSRTVLSIRARATKRSRFFHTKWL